MLLTSLVYIIKISSMSMYSIDHNYCNCYCSLFIVFLEIINPIHIEKYRSLFEAFGLCASKICTMKTTILTAVCIASAW